MDLSRFLTIGLCPALLIVLSLLTGCSRVATDQLPSLTEPNTTGMLPIVAQQLETLHADAVASPRDASAAAELGMAYLAYERFEAAIAALERAHLLRPGKWEWQYLLAMASRRAGDFDTATAMLEALAQRRPKDSVIKVRLGQVYVRLGEIDKARALFEQVVATDDENAEARLELARLQMKYGDPETAKVLLEGLLFRYGPTAVTYAALAETLRRLGDEEQSQYYQALIPQYRGLSLPGSDPVLVEVQRLNLGDKHLIDGAKSMLAKGETDNGIRLLEIALKRNPNSVPAYAWLLAAHGSRGEFDLVEQYYQQALEAGPPTLNLLANLGKARARNGQFAEARVAFQQALELDPQNASMKAALGSVARREGQAAEAEHLFKEAVRLDPLHRAAHFSLGEMLVQQKRYEEAIEHLEAAVRDPDRATVAALTYLGFTTTQMGQTDAARSYLRRALLIAEEMGDPGQGQRAQRMLDAMP